MMGTRDPICDLMVYQGLARHMASHAGETFHLCFLAGAQDVGVRIEQDSSSLSNRRMPTTRYQSQGGTDGE